MEKIMTKDENWIQLLKKNILLEDIENGEGYIIFLFYYSCQIFRRQKPKRCVCRKVFARDAGVKGHRAYIL